MGSNVKSVWDVAFLEIQDFFFGFVEVVLGDFHSSFSQSKETGFSAHGFDVGTWEIVFGLDEISDRNVIVEAHFGGVDLEDFVFGFEVWDWEFNFSIDTSGPDEGWIEAFYFVRGHDNFDFCVGVETVQLIKELEHSSLDFFLSSGVGVVSLGTDGVDFVDEDDGGWVFLCGLEKFSDKFGSISQILLDKFRADNSQESSRGFTGNSLG